jgi:hypothetical protein
MRASGYLKDQNSIWIASLTRKTSLRNPDIERALIRATSHDHTHVDYRNSQKIFAWLRLSSAYINPLLFAISVRMERTRSWIVALKGLMLMHGVFCCQLSAIHKIGRLPFDLSNFRDSHLNPRQNWGYNTFIRSYYAFLDRKSILIFTHPNDRGKSSYSMKRDIAGLQKMQGLLDLLLQIKPQAEEMVDGLLLEAMDCIIVEIFDVYSKICNGIARVLMKIHSAGKVEAEMALKVLSKAKMQSEELSVYFEFCKDMGVIHASDCPKVEQISEADIREIEQILNGVGERAQKNGKFKEKKTQQKHERTDSNGSLQTVITDKWEVFDEEQRMNSTDLPIIHVQTKSQDLPDLISF